jgi:hypothetical protein
MIAIQRYPRKRWTAILRHYGCIPAEGIPKRPDGEFWRWPWPHAWPFFVPFDEQGYLDTWALIYILQAMREKAPDGWTFPPNPPA